MEPKKLSYRDEQQQLWATLSVEERLERCKTMDYGVYFTLKPVMTQEELEAYKQVEKARGDALSAVIWKYTFWGVGVYFVGFILWIFFGKNISAVFAPSDCDVATNNRLTVDRHVSDLESSGKQVYGTTRTFQNTLKNTERDACR